MCDERVGAHVEIERERKKEREEEEENILNAGWPSYTEHSSNAPAFHVLFESTSSLFSILQAHGPPLVAPGPPLVAPLVAPGPPLVAPLVAPGPPLVAPGPPLVAGAKPVAAVSSCHAEHQQAHPLRGLLQSCCGADAAPSDCFCVGVGVQSSSEPT